jgi:sarcosine oxidase
VPERHHRNDTRHRCIVIGGGLLGLSVASALAHRGCPSLVLEPDPPGHARSGSKGSARIFRLGYPDPLYVAMALRARDLWRDLEDRTGCALLHVTGQVTFGPLAETVAAALSAVGVPFQRLTATEAARNFPGVNIGGPALIEPGSGVLVADECLRALRTRAGAVDPEPELVAGVEQDADTATVVLADGRELSADVVVNCAGTGALSLMGDVPCPVAQPPSLQQVAYFAPRSAGPLPIVIEWDDDMTYGLPVVGQPLYKVSHHRPGPAVDVRAFDAVDDPALLTRLTAAVRRLLPGLDPEPRSTERCLYDNTGDSDFIIDRVGRIVIGCGTSGHGFKFGPLLGELLADLALGSDPPIDLARFALGRAHPGASSTP